LVATKRPADARVVLAWLASMASPDENALQPSTNLQPIAV
jgi:hypothetical protein